ncbi:hypothetical protein U9M48_006909 [Paspalum notatum var. saurae]|uniref:Peroxisomal nicotinamide adenine dinucleotide carrier n=1 Tax=Paspalum notatum var. saurae TaxID=547442 RepID=A0AAQ3SGK7_PASNO
MELEETLKKRAQNGNWMLKQAGVPCAEGTASCSSLNSEFNEKQTLIKAREGKKKDRAERVDSTPPGRPASALLPSPTIQGDRAGGGGGSNPLGDGVGVQFCTPRRCDPQPLAGEAGRPGGGDWRARASGEMSDALINGLAGAGGGIIAQILTYPLQTVNARQQTERDPSKPAFKDGAARQLYLVVKHEGWERLYGGLMPSLVGTAASQGVYYYFYQIFRNRAEAKALERSRRGLGDGSVGMLQSLAVAALSGCVNVLLTNPIWVVVTRMQTHRKTNKKKSPQGLTFALDNAVEAATTENTPYRTIDVVSNPAIQFMLYETLLKKLKNRRASNLKGADGLTALEIFLLGAVAKLGATVVTYPLLVVKARLQVKQMIDDDKRHRYKGTFDAITKLVQYEGLTGMYKGMGTKIVQSVFASALLFMIKEELVKGARLLVTGNTSLVKKLPSKSSR